LASDDIGAEKCALRVSFVIDFLLVVFFAVEVVNVLQEGNESEERMFCIYVAAIWCLFGGSSGAKGTAAFGQMTMMAPEVMTT
jgi:hypothetical protein